MSLYSATHATIGFTMRLRCISYITLAVARPPRSTTVPCIPVMGFIPWSSPFGDNHSTRKSAAPEAWTLKSKIRHHEEKSYGSVLTYHNHGILHCHHNHSMTEYCLSVCLSVVFYFWFTVLWALLPEIKDSILFYSILL